MREGGGLKLAYALVGRAKSNVATFNVALASAKEGRPIEA